MIYFFSCSILFIFIYICVFMFILIKYHISCMIITSLVHDKFLLLYSTLLYLVVFIYKLSVKIKSLHFSHLTSAWYISSTLLYSTLLYLIVFIYKLSVKIKSLHFSHLTSAWYISSASSIIIPNSTKYSKIEK